MSSPGGQDQLPWRALEIGPGGIPPEQVAPVGFAAPVALAAQAEVPDAWRNWMQAVDDVASPEKRMSAALIIKIVGGLAVLGLVVGLAVWANASNPLGSSRSSQVAVADCLSSTGERIGAVVSCDSDKADFLVVGRYPDSSDATDCSATPSDVAVVLGGPTVLCLDYVATVGDCIFAGTQAGGVGKVNCDSTLPGVYRVDEVLHNNIDPDDCPSGTTQTLVHLHNSEVICLGRT